MADIQDLEDTGEIGELEAVEQEIAQEPEKQESDDDLDPRYRGKSAKEIAKMHQEAEKLIARQSQEVGEVRRLADELIKSQLKKPEEEKPQVDFFENPEEAVRKAVENNPEVLQAKQYAVQARQQMARQELLSKHPDALELVKDEGFRNWINSSPVRTRLAIQADQQYDVEAADELYSTYKELKGVREKKVSEVEKTARDKTLRSASVETGGSGESSKKVYRRADLIQLKLKDPQAFAARQDEIDAAYREGRVR